MRKASGRFSIRHLLRSMPTDDEPTTLLRAEELLARLCATAPWTSRWPTSFWHVG
jgi:hypothetical protein